MFIYDYVLHMQQFTTLRTCISLMPYMVLCFTHCTHPRLDICLDILSLRRSELFIVCGR